MPELPEVEVTRQSFMRAIEGSQVLDVRLGKPLRWPLGCPPSHLTGRRVGATSRRGKYLWLPLDDQGLLLHLGMSGSLAFLRQPPPAGPHDHFELVTNRGTLRLTDPRRFGAVVWSPSIDSGTAAKLLAGLGREPLDPGFDGAHLYAGLQRTTVTIKQALLAGRIVVGAGNIYACEALFRAGIHPETCSNRISRSRCQRLATALRDTLTEALQLGGSTLRDFRDAHGMAGQFQAQACVYGREGQSCGACGATIRRITQGQRSTFYCPICQKR